MGRGYTIGCPGISGWEYALMGLGCLALLLIVTVVYQFAFEKYEFARKVRRARAEAEGE